MKQIQNVVVLGSSGTVGSLVGGLFAQQEIKVSFLSRSLQGAKAGLKKAVAQARSEVISRYIEYGDYDHSFQTALQKADFIIECVSENLEIKKKIYNRVERYRKPDTIIGTTTSSLPLTALTEGQSDNFKKNFLSTHFYNPPGKMLACEIAGTENTDIEVYRFVKKFLEDILLRVVIPVKNIPGFAGNRIAFLLFSKITELVPEYGVEMTDYLIGPYTGRLMPPLATLDLVGLDIHKAIIESLRRNTFDEMHDCFKLPSYIEKMIEMGLLGSKTKGGFYKKTESGKRLFYDSTSCDYVPAIEPHLGFVEKAKSLIHLGMYRKAFETIINTQSKEAEIVLDSLCTYVAYSFSRIGDVTEAKYGINGINTVMSSGFHWAPPSLIVDMLGGYKAIVELLSTRGFEVPETLTNGHTTYPIHNSGKFFIAR